MKLLLRVVKPLDNHRGIALVLAILLLMVITLFGALGITMSTREIRGAGANRLGEQRFYEAQLGVTQSLLSPSWLTDDFLATPVTTTKDSRTVKDPLSNNPLAEVVILAIQDVDPDLAAKHRLPLQPHVTEPPAGSGYSLGHFQVRRFSVTSTTSAETGRSEIREGVWRAFHK